LAQTDRTEDLIGELTVVVILYIQEPLSTHHLNKPGI